MTEKLRCVPKEAIITGWDFSTGGVKCLAFNLAGKTVAEIRLPTDLWHGKHDESGKLLETGLNELNLMQLEGQARASVRAIVAELRKLGYLKRWAAGGISATHHTAGRIDQNHNQVRRAICWNDQSLAACRQEGEDRLGGERSVRDLIGGPWADRYSLSHLVKDEKFLKEEQWRATYRILPHGPLAAGYLTGNFDVISVSSAASTGLMDLRTCSWQTGMLQALASPEYRNLAEQQLPRIVDQYEPIGRLAASLAVENGIDPQKLPLIFPTSDDQQAGLAGGRAVSDGQMAVILGNSAVVNSSSSGVPASGNLDVMRLNWGPYLWMRCYNNGAQFVDTIIPPDPQWEESDWNRLEAEAEAIDEGCNGIAVMPFLHPEPSLAIHCSNMTWFGKDGQKTEKPADRGIQRRASFEALAYLIALGVRAHEEAGQQIAQIAVSGGIARSTLMCKILAGVLNRPLQRLVSHEGPALGAAATALAALETNLRREQGIQEEFTVADAVAKMVHFSETIQPDPDWRETYKTGLHQFEARVKQLAAK